MKRDKIPGLQDALDLAAKDLIDAARRGEKWTHTELASAIGVRLGETPQSTIVELALYEFAVSLARKHHFSLPDHLAQASLFGQAFAENQWLSVRIKEVSEPDEDDGEEIDEDKTNADDERNSKIKVYRVPMPYANWDYILQHGEAIQDNKKRIEKAEAKWEKLIEPWRPIMEPDRTKLVIDAQIILGNWVKPK